MHPYGVRQVGKLLGLPESTIRALIRAGFVKPARGPRGAWRFSFQDLIVLRTAQALAAAKVPRQRITRSMRELRRHLPESMPLSGLSIAAEADRVVVRDGKKRWQADSGQYLLSFDGDPSGGSLRIMEKALEAPQPSPDPDQYIEQALELHEAGRLAEAERLYRQGLHACGPDAVILFNLGVLLEDLRRGRDAARAYEECIAIDPAFADCHYNLALLYDALGRPKEAIRHMGQYRRLVRRK